MSHNNVIVFCVILAVFVNLIICDFNRTFVPDCKTNCANFSVQLDDYWPQLVKQVEASKELKLSSNMEDIKHDVLLVLKAAFPNDTIDMKLFGSRMTGAGNENSDLDIYVRVESYQRNMSRRMELEQIFKAAEMFYRQFNQTWVSVNTITRAKVPIICLVHKSTNIDVDINFSDPLSSNHDLLISYLFDLQPIARYMVHYLRHRASSLELQQYLRSHHHSLMVVYFLQLKNLLPKIVEMHNNFGEDFQTIGIKIKELSPDLSKLERIDVSYENTQKMLQEYLKFYANFDYNKYTICAYYGTWLTRANLLHLKPKVFNYRIRTFTTPIVIQDILKLSDNNAKNITLEHFQRFFI